MNWEELLCADRIRSFHKTGSTDLRSEYEKDLHRIIVSASFRRLQDKTQVFPLDKSDFVRTRLTHSLEVSSVSKSLAQNIGRSITRNIKDPTFKPENQADISARVFSTTSGTRRSVISARRLSAVFLKRISPRSPTAWRGPSMRSRCRSF